MHEKKAKIIMEDLKKIYELIASQFSETRNSARGDFKPFDIYLKQDQNILDLGCGNGRLLLHLEKTKINGSHLKFYYQGIDSGKELINLAQSRHPHHKFTYGDQLTIPVRDDKFDIIFNIRSFHHIPSKKLRIDALKEMQRVIKKDGILIITVWNLWQWKYLKNIIIALIRSILTLGAYEYNDTFIKWGKKHKRYYHAFTLRELKQLAKKTPLKIIKSGKLNHDFQIILKKCIE